jgi:uncharacterized protein YpmB
MIIIVPIVLILAAIGAYVLDSSHASTPYSSVETESGILANGAAI